MENTENVVICTRCGKQLQIEGLHREEYIEITKKWGYFSRKDGQKHHLILCEQCYDEITASFAHKIETEEETELL